MIMLAATATACLCTSNLASRVESAQTTDRAFVELNQSDNLLSPPFTNGYEALRF